MALSRRHLLPALKEPEYEMEDVPKATRDLGGSAARRIMKRDDWLNMLAEMVLLTNRAGEEHEQRLKQSNQPIIHGGKALGLEYMADRIDTDDPLWGWAIRSCKEGWLQGYICVTTFTTWQRWFRWDSLCECAGIIPVDRDHKPPTTEEEIKSQEWWDNRIVDADGRLARALNRQIRDGDWTDEGVIWPHLAEISLLGGLGCGGVLLDAVIEELSSAEKRQYDYIVVQATENAVPFYESRGFVRVGAVARYEQKLTEEEQLHAPSKTSSSSRVNGSSTKKEEEDMVPPDDLSSMTVTESHIITGTSSPCNWISTEPGDNPIKIAERLKVKASDIVFLNRRLYSEITENSLLKPRTRLRVPRVDQYDARRGGEPIMPFTLKAKDLVDIYKNDAKPGLESSNGHWYSAINGETVKNVAKKLGVSATALAAFNRARYGSLEVRSALQGSTILWIPQRPLDLNKVHKHGAVEEEEANGVHPEIMSEASIREVERQLHEKEVIDDSLITFYATTKCDNVSIVEGKLTKKLSEVMAYRHWTFPDDPSADLSSPSYMMVLPLNKEYLKKHVPSIRKGESALKRIQALELRQFPVPPSAYRDASAPPLDPSSASVSVGSPGQPNADRSPVAPVTPSEARTEKRGSRSPETCEVFVRSEAIKLWRQGPLEGPDGKKVYVKGSEISGGDLTADFPHGGPKPRPPQPPRRPITSFMEFSTVKRPEYIEKYPGKQPKDITVLISDAWRRLTPEERTEFERTSEINRAQYHAAMEKYRRDLVEYHAKYGLDEELYDVDDPSDPKLRSVRPKRSKIFLDDDDSELDEPKKEVEGRRQVQHMLDQANLPAGLPRLFNKVVMLKPKSSAPYREIWLNTKGSIQQDEATLSTQNVKIDLPDASISAIQSEDKAVQSELSNAQENKEQHSAGNADASCELPDGNAPSTQGTAFVPKYYFTLTYIPDMQWCRLAPLMPAGVFEPGAFKRKNYEKHVGRPRWVLAPEEVSKEIDVSSSRCIPIRSTPVKNVTDADQEEWDLDV